MNAFLGDGHEAASVFSVFLIAAHREAGVDVGEHDVARPGVKRTVDDAHVPELDPRGRHGRARAPHEKGGERILHEHAVEVNLPHRALPDRRRRPAGHAKLDAGDRSHALGGCKAKRLELVPATGLKDGGSGLKGGHDGKPFLLDDVDDVGGSRNHSPSRAGVRPRKRNGERPRRTAPRRTQWLMIRCISPSRTSPCTPLRRSRS